MLPQGGSHPKPQFGKAIQLRCYSLHMAMLFRFDEDPDRPHTANTKSSGPSAGRAIVQNHECIGQGTGQVKRTALSGTKLGVVVSSGGLSDFDPGLAQVRNIAPPRPAAVKLLIYLEGDDDLAKEKRQQLKTAQPVQVDQWRRIRDDFRHGWTAKSPVRGPALPGFLGRR